VSAIIAPDGALLAHTGTWQQAILDGKVPLVSSLTLADRLGQWPEYVITALTLAAFAWAIGSARRRRNRPAGRTVTGS
jgi:apolipoprotein N-acyltransferase